MSSARGYTSIRPLPISNEASSINKFVDLVKRTKDQKARYLPRHTEFDATQYTSTSSTWSNGPNPLFVPLSVKPGNFVALYLEADIRIDSGASNTGCYIGIYESTDIPSTSAVNGALTSTGASQWTFGFGVWNRISSTLGTTGIPWPVGAWIVLKPTTGIRVYYFQTHVANPGQATIKNRRIWGMLL